MAKKHLYNILRIFILCLLQSSITACNTSTMKKYKWTVSDCAPIKYPCEIYRGSLHYGKTSGASVPSGKYINNGWGRAGTRYAKATEKEVPHRLDIVWLSYRENKFYGGSFNLPVAKMEQLFEEGFLDISDKSKENVKKTYYEIVVGVGPGGVVGVWLTGPGHNIQVATFYGEETEVDFADFNPDGIKDRDRFVKEITAGRVSHTELSNPIDFKSWEYNAQSFNWQPKIEGTIVDYAFFTKMIYYNANKEILVKKEAHTIPLKQRTIPKVINFNWSRNPDGYRVESEFEFDKEEIFSVFKELFTDPKTQQAELIFKYKAKKDVEVFLKVGDQQKKLEKVQLGTFKSIH